MEKMNISEEDRIQLIEQLETQLGTKSLLYLKFCECEKFAQDVCEGNLYANTAKHFREKEIASGERGQGDQYELLNIIETQKITVCDAETREVIFTAPKGTMKNQFKQDDIIPLVSFVGIPLSEMELVYADETHADFVFPFTDDEYAMMKEKFGPYCVMINAREIEAKIKKYCEAIGCDYVFDAIEYCNQNRLDRMEAFAKGAKERFLYKNKDLDYQREYRLALGIEIPEDHFIRIGQLGNAKFLESEKLRDMCLSIGYKSQKRSEE